MQSTATQFEALVDTIVDGVIVIDAKGHIRLYNASCERIFGYFAEETIGQNVKMLMPAPHQELHDHYLSSYQQTRERKIIGLGREVEGRRKDGSTFPLALSVGEASQDGEKLYVGVVQDISDRKRVEQQREELIGKLTASSEERGHFAHVASHDLQQHLRTILMFSEMLREDCGDVLDEEALGSLAAIEDAAKDMRATIEDLMVYGRLGFEPERKSWFDSAAVLKRVVERARSAAPDRPIEFRIGELPQVYGNPVRFSRLMQNIVGNAVRYSSKSEVLQVRIDARDLAEHWEFSVADNGIGIPREYHDTIFEPFKRLHRRSEFPGSGLGLSICKKIVIGMGGRIWVDSTPGDGATFSFTMPKDGSS